jgi:hypothetical protein
MSKVQISAHKTQEIERWCGNQRLGVSGQNFRREKEGAAERQLLLWFWIDLETDLETQLDKTRSAVIRHLPE